MMIPVLTLAIGMASPSQADEPDFTRPHNWRVVAEGHMSSAAVMADVPAGAGDQREMWLMVTTANPISLEDGSRSSQTVIAYDVNCAARTADHFYVQPGRPNEPPYQFEPEASSNAVPVTPAPRTPREVVPGTALERAVRVVCGRGVPDAPAIRGEWRNVLRSLQDRVTTLHLRPFTPEPSDAAWHVVDARPGRSIAVQVARRPEGAEYGTAAVVITRTRSMGVEQVWQDFSVLCPGQGRVAFEPRQLAGYVSPLGQPLVISAPKGYPPIADWDFEAANPIHVAVQAVCSGEWQAGEGVQGDWSEILTRFAELTPRT